MSTFVAIGVILLLLAVLVITPAVVGLTIGGGDVQIVAWLTAVTSLAVNYLVSSITERVS